VPCADAAAQVGFAGGFQADARLGVQPAGEQQKIAPVRRQRQRQRRQAVRVLQYRGFETLSLRQVSRSHRLADPAAGGMTMALPVEARWLRAALARRLARRPRPPGIRVPVLWTIGRPPGTTAADSHDAILELRSAPSTS
jgi:pimeloyl-ACP methyl ester carboxylesterase